MNSPCPNPFCKGGNQARKLGNYWKCTDCDGKGFVTPQKGPLQAPQPAYAAPWHSALVSALKPIVDGTAAQKEASRVKRLQRAADKRAQAAGFESYQARLDSGWTPLDGIRNAAKRRRRRNRVPACDQGGGIWRGKPENPFFDERESWHHNCPPLGSF